MFIGVVSRLTKPSLEDWVLMGKDWHRAILHGKGRETPQQLASIVLRAHGYVHSSGQCSELC